jgi:LPXTG-motif cell wall-anchored protein
MKGTLMDKATGKPLKATVDTKTDTTVTVLNQKYQYSKDTFTYTNEDSHYHFDANCADIPAEGEKLEGNVKDIDAAGAFKTESTEGILTVCEKCKGDNVIIINDEPKTVACTSVAQKGGSITAEVKFTPTSPDGSVELAFVFNGVDLTGKTAVAFEELHINKGIVAVHADINDEAQTVYIPEIRTDAKLKNKVVEDKITYKNLIPGKYIARGWLVDKKTGKKLTKSDGEQAFTLNEFTAKGYIKVNLPVTGYSKLSGYSLVAFEELYFVTTDENGKEVEILVAEHKDKNDKAQTVKIPNAKTGDNSKLYLFGGMFAVLVVAGTAYVYRRRKTSKNEE